MIDREQMLERARSAARFADPDLRELHVMPNSRHAASATCWCTPELTYQDPETSVAVYGHHEPA